MSATSSCARTNRLGRRWHAPRGWSPSPIPDRSSCRRLPTTRSPRAQTGWAAESLGRFDVVGLDPGTHIYQLVGAGFGSDFPPLRVDRLPPVPGGVDRSAPGYELRSLIGIGQLGEVHRAYQPAVGREVALRTFGRGMVSHPRFVRRFETVSQRITRVEHPHVVPLLDYWWEPDRAVMVSRLMTGGNLAELIPPDGFGTARALELAETIGSAVASAHRHGVTHGRLRPENVLFDAEGTRSWRTWASTRSLPA